MSAPKLGRLWFVLWDEPNLRKTALLGAGICLTILLVSYVLTRIDHSRPAEDYGLWLFFSVAIGYVIANGTYLLPKTRDDLDALRPILNLEEDAFEEIRHGLFHHPRGAMRVQTMLGLAAGVVHDTALNGMFASLLEGCSPSPLDVLVGFCTIAIWTLMFQLGGALTRNAVVFSQLGRRSVRLSLFDRRPLAAFGRTALRPALLLVGVQVAFPLLWIQQSFQYVQAVPGLIATVTVILAVFLLPLLGIHRRLLETKRRAADRVSSAIASAERVLDNGDAPIPDPDRTRLAELVTLKREIEATSSWPIDVPVMRHLGLYLILPPLTWVGAALIENVVQALL